MAKKGKMLYCPFPVIQEVEDIQREDRIDNRAYAFRELVKYARVGREVNRIMRLDWRRAKKLPPILIPQRVEKKKKWGRPKKESRNNLFGGGVF